MALPQSTVSSGGDMITLRLLTGNLSFLSKQINKSDLRAVSKLFHTNTANFVNQKMNETRANEIIKQLAPPLTNDKHKGQAGRIGIFGGSLEYTGAPYFAAISSLRVGSDLVYVFCPKEAATVIKSYSPELIVLPLLNEAGGVSLIEPWIDRLHTVLIGPGLGRENATFEFIEQIITICRNKKKPLVIDADGLFFVSIKPQVLKNYPAHIILTPNAMEFKRLVGNDPAGDGDKVAQSTNFLKMLGGNVTLLCKDHEDDIIHNGQTLKLKGGGSGRRCGGQGDLLSGAVSTFLTWSLQQENANNVEDFRPTVACYAASRLTRECNARAFAKHGRSMICTDMIQEIHDVFQDNFELKN